MPNGLAGSAQVSYPLLAPSGTAGAPSYGFAASPTTGMYSYSAGGIAFACAGVDVLFMNTGGPGLYTGRVFAFNSGGTTAFVSTSNGVLTQSDSSAGNNPQSLRLTGTSVGPRYLSLGHTGTVGEMRSDGNVNVYIDGNQTLALGGLNSEIIVRGLGTIAHSGSEFRVTTSSGSVRVGPDSPASVGLWTDATERWRVTSAGHLLPVADNTYDIGVTATSRVRQYFGVYVYCDGFIQSSEAFRLANRARIQGGASDGIVQITDWAGTDFGRLCFGGVTNLFPAIKRNGANLDFVPADGSASYINLTCHDVIASSVYLSNIVAVGANNTNFVLGGGGITANLVNSAASFIIQVTGGAVLATFAGTGYLEMTEVTAPSAPAANSGRLYFEDNGAGKTRLMCLFGSGAAQQIAIEP